MCRSHVTVHTFIKRVVKMYVLQAEICDFAVNKLCSYWIDGSYCTMYRQKI